MHLLLLNQLPVASRFFADNVSVDVSRNAEGTKDTLKLKDSEIFLNAIRGLDPKEKIVLTDRLLPKKPVSRKALALSLGVKEITSRMMEQAIIEKFQEAKRTQDVYLEQKISASRQPIAPQPDVAVATAADHIFG